MSRVEENIEMIRETNKAIDLINKVKGVADITPEELNGLLAPSNLLILSDISKSLAVIADKMEGGKDGH